MKKLFLLLALLAAPAFAQPLPTASSLLGEWDGVDGRGLPCHVSVKESRGFFAFTGSGADGTARLDLVPASELDAKIAENDEFRRKNDPDYTGVNPSLGYNRGANEIDAGWQNGAPSYLNVTNATFSGPFIDVETRVVAVCFGLRRAP